MSDDRNAPRALIVDDDVLARRALVRAFVQEGFVCDVASNGVQALEKLRARPVDLALTDLCMPEMNGHRLVVQILDMDPAPVVMVLTGFPQPKIVRDLLARGVEDVVAKPADQEVVALRAKSIVQRRREQALTARAERADVYGEIRSVDARKVATQMTQVRQSLSVPPSTYDAFRRASSDAFGTAELAALIRSVPESAKEVLTLANAVMFQASEERRHLESLRNGSGGASLATHPIAVAIALAIGLLLGIGGSMAARLY